MSEMLDVVDPQTGEPTGQALDKAAIHAGGLWHRDVHVWLTNGRDVLEQQRTWDKAIMPGQWDVSVGGHVLAGETYLDAAVRETEEELGLCFAPERFIPAGKLAVDMVMGTGKTAWRHRVVGDHFVVVERDLSLDDITVQPSEVLGARWYDIAQLEADIAYPHTVARHAGQPPELWALGIAAMREAVRA